MHAQALVVDCLVCDDNTTVYIACFFVSLCSTGFWTGGEILSRPVLVKLVLKYNRAVKIKSVVVQSASLLAPLP